MYKRNNIAVKIADGRVVYLTPEMLKQIADLQENAGKWSSLSEALTLDLRALNKLVLHDADDLDIAYDTRIAMLQTIDDLKRLVFRLSTTQMLVPGMPGVYIDGSDTIKLTKDADELRKLADADADKKEDSDYDLGDSDPEENADDSDLEDDAD